MTPPTLTIHWSRHLDQGGAAAGADADAVTVDSPDALADVLDRLLSGEDVVVVADSDDPLAALLVDQAERCATLRTEVESTLSAESADLLVLLGSGLTTAHAARLLHLSTRSAYRLLAEARTALGVATTAEAVLAVRSRVEDTA